MFERIPHVVDVQIAWCGNSSQLLVEDCPSRIDRRTRKGPLHIRNGLPGQTLEGGRVRDPALWGSFADCVEMVKARHPQVAQDMMTGFVSQRSGCLSSVTGAVNRLLEVGVHGLQMVCARDLGFAEWECEGRGWQRHEGTGGVASPLFGGESIGEVAKWAPLRQSLAQPCQSTGSQEGIQNRSECCS